MEIMYVGAESINRGRVYRLDEGLVKRYFAIKHLWVIAQDIKEGDFEKIVNDLSNVDPIMMKPRYYAMGESDDKNPIGSYNIEKKELTHSGIEGISAKLGSDLYIKFIPRKEFLEKIYSNDYENDVVVQKIKEMNKPNYLKIYARKDSCNLALDSCQLVLDFLKNHTIRSEAIDDFNVIGGLLVHEYLGLPLKWKDVAEVINVILEENNLSYVKEVWFKSDEEAKAHSCLKK